MLYGNAPYWLGAWCRTDKECGCKRSPFVVQVGLLFEARFTYVLTDL